MVEISDLETRRQALERDYTQLKSDWLTDETYYDGTFKLTLPSKVHKTVPATGRNAVDVPANHIVTDKPLVTRRSQLIGERRQERDDKIEAWGQAWLQEIEELSETPPLVEAVKLQLLRGQAILLGPFYNRQRYDKGDDLYVWFDAEDPMNVFMPSGPDPREVFIQSEMTVDEMEQRARMNPRLKNWDRGGRTSERIVKLVEWYGYGYDGEDNEDVCQYAAWEATGSDWIASPRPSGYPYLPAERVYSGYGRRKRGGKPEELSASIINTQVKTLLEDEVFAFSVCASAMGAAVWERWRAPDQTTVNRIDMDYEPGSVSIIPQDVTRIQQEALPQAVLQHLSNVQRALEQALFSGVIQGQRPVGVETASGLAILSGQARLKFGTPLKLLETGVARVVRKVGMLMEYLNEKDKDEEIVFPMRGRELRAIDWDGDYAVHVQLMSTDPEEEATRIARGVSLVGKGPSMRYIAENFWRIENWTEQEEQNLYEAVINSQEMKQLLVTALDSLRQYAGMPETAPTQMQPTGQPSGLQQLEAMAANMRAARPGGMVQQKALPGTVEAERVMAGLATGGLRGQPR